jgi:hypothetical protein
MKRMLIAGASLLASVTVAQAIECAVELPASRSGHWSWRMIDGRKCWYQGRSTLPKSELHWPAQSLADAQALMTVTDGAAGLDPDDGSFASRWRGLEAKVR